MAQPSGVRWFGESWGAPVCALSPAVPTPARTLNRAPIVDPGAF
jgi:hypothetical protein